MLLKNLATAYPTKIQAKSGILAMNYCDSKRTKFSLEEMDNTAVWRQPKAKVVGIMALPFEAKTDETQLWKAAQIALRAWSERDYLENVIASMPRGRLATPSYSLSLVRERVRVRAYKFPLVVLSECSERRIQGGEAFLL